MPTIAIVSFIHDPESDYCPCDDCAVARDVVCGLTGITLDDQPGTFTLDEVPLSVP